MMFFCFKHKTAYEMRISDWSSDVCSSDLRRSRRRSRRAWSMPSASTSPRAFVADPRKAEREQAGRPKTPRANFRLASAPHETLGNQPVSRRARVAGARTGGREAEGGGLLSR